MLVKNAKVFFLEDKKTSKPPFKRRPTVFVTPLSKDVDLVSVQFTERWAMVGGGSNGELEELLLFSDSCEGEGKHLFEVSLQLSVPCRLHGSNDKSGWHGVVVRASAEEGAHKKHKHYWKDLQLSKLTPRKRFDKKPFRHSEE